MEERGKVFIGDKLRELRKKMALNSARMGKLAGISQGAYSALENNKSEASTWPIYNLLKNTNVNPFWLLLGTGPMMNLNGKPAEEDPKVRDIMELISADPDRRELVYDFLTNLRELDRLADLIQHHLKKKKKPENF